MVDVLSVSGEVKSQVELPRELFGLEPDTGAVWAAVRMHLANRRQGTAKVKTRAEVSGTGKKPWRQKHTGRARHGSRRSPIWRGGGVVFGPLPRDYSGRLPKKERSRALASALSARHAENAVRVVEDITLGQPKTKELLAVLSRLNLTGSVLLLVDAPKRELLLAGRNVNWLTVLPAAQVGPYDLLHHDTVLFTESGLASLVKRAGRGVA